MAITSVTYRIYRNEVEVFQGQFLGSTQISYTPPDAAPANYRIAFFVDGAAVNLVGSIGRRTISMIGYRR